MVEVVVTSADDVYLLGIYQDADLSPTWALRHRERNASYTLTTAHLGELHRCNHGTNAITVTVPFGLWPAETGEDVVELSVCRVGNAQVFIRADAGTTGMAPMQLRLATTTAGVTQYNRGDGQMHNQYELESVGDPPAADPQDRRHDRRAVPRRHPLTQHQPGVCAMDLYKTGKAMLLMAGLQAAITLLAFIGRGLELSDAERRTILGRIEAALLDPAAGSRA